MKNFHQNFDKMTHMNGIPKDLIDEFLHGWCHVLAEELFRKIGGEIYEFFDNEGDGWKGYHDILKYNNCFIDVSGIYTEHEAIDIMQLRKRTGKNCLTLDDMKNKNSMLSLIKRNRHVYQPTEYKLEKCEILDDISDFPENWLKEADKLSDYIIFTEEFKAIEEKNLINLITLKLIDDWDKNRLDISVLHTNGSGLDKLAKMVKIIAPLSNIVITDHMNFIEIDTNETDLSDFQLFVRFIGLKISKKLPEMWKYYDDTLVCFSFLEETVKIVIKFYSTDEEIIIDNIKSTEKFKNYIGYREYYEGLTYDFNNVSIHKNNTHISLTFETFPDDYELLESDRFNKFEETPNTWFLHQNDPCNTLINEKETRTGFSVGISEISGYKPDYCCMQYNNQKYLYVFIFYDFSKGSDLRRIFLSFIGDDDTVNFYDKNQVAILSHKIMENYDFEIESFVKNNEEINSDDIGGSLTFSILH